MIDFEPRELVATIERNGVSASLISVLEEIQAHYRYLPQEAMVLVSERLGVPVSQVFSVATFYNAFSLERRGRHGICVCVGTACHVRGSRRVLTRLEERLGVKSGSTTPDWNYSLDTVHCLGACALGPIVVIDGEYSGQVNANQVDELLSRTRQADKVEA